MSADIKLFVCCHKYENVPEHPLLVPIQVGAALAEQHFNGFLHDDTGENISAKNRSYCELTAQYWAWKNVDADYYGIFHYRRYLYPAAKARRPYRICGSPDEEFLKRLGYSNFDQLISNYDLIAPIPENMYISVREHYANAPHHRKRDLSLAEGIVLEKHPEMADSLEKYLSGTECFFGNICIMKSHLFKNYCSWLFDILGEFDRRADTTDYTAQERRVDGYLAERLFGIYYTHRKNELKTIELPRVHFESDGINCCKNQLVNSILPPGTKQRAYVKSMIFRKRIRKV